MLFVSILIMITLTSTLFLLYYHFRYGKFKEEKPNSKAWIIYGYFPPIAYLVFFREIFFAFIRNGFPSSIVILEELLTLFFFSYGLDIFLTEHYYLSRYGIANLTGSERKIKKEPSSAFELLILACIIVSLILMFLHSTFTNDLILIYFFVTSIIARCLLWTRRILVDKAYRIDLKSPDIFADKK